MTAIGQTFVVDMPAGGQLYLQSAEEVELWEKSHTRYIEDYHLNKTNDLVILGGLLQQQVLLFRAQRSINGMEPVLDNQNVPTGQYRVKEMDDGEKAAARKALNEAMSEIGKAERALGIDKVSREAGGTVTTEDYLRRLKRAAHDRGIHLNERFIAYEFFVNALRTKIRMLNNLDAEDRAYEGVPDAETVLKWADAELLGLAQKDMDYAKNTHKLYVGKL